MAIMVAWSLRQTSLTAQKCMPWLSYERLLTMYMYVYMLDNML